VELWLMQGEAGSMTASSGLRVLVFRAAADAARTAHVLVEAGYKPVTAPLFTIVPTGEVAPPGPFDAILLASAHAVPFADPMRDLPVFAVGSQTAKAATAAGHGPVHVADGDRWALSRLIRDHVPPKARLLAVLGRDRHEDWLEALAGDGFGVIVWTAYEARLADRLPETVETLLASPRLAQDRLSALHFSARSAAGFIELAQAGPAKGAMGLINHVVMSEEVARPLVAAGCHRIFVAAAADMPGMLAALKRAVVQPEAISAVVDKAPSYRNPAQRAVEGARSASEMDRVTSKASGPAADVAMLQPQGEMPHSIQEVQVSAEPEQAHQRHAPLPESTADDAAAGDAMAPPIPAPRRSAPGWGGLILSGVLGGIVGAGGVYEAQNLFGARQASPSATAASTAAAEQRLAAIEAGLSQAQDQAVKAAAAAEAASRKMEIVAAAAPAAGSVPSQPGTSQPGATSLAAATEVKALTERLGRLEEGSAQSGAAADAVLPRLAGLEAAARSIGTPSAQASAATQLLLVDRVRHGLETGQGIEPNVRGLAAAGVTADRLAPLATMAARPVATRATLRDELGRLRREMSQDSAAAPASWSDKALALAGRIVSVQKIDATGPATPPVLVARIETALASGDFAAANAAWKALPEPNRRASAGFGASLNARADADAALAGIDAAAVAALTAR
jgi:uroporphyrinogen-III synthase